MKAIVVLLAVVPCCVALAQGSSQALQVGARVRLVATDTTGSLEQPTFIRAAGSLAAIEAQALVVRPGAFAPTPDYRDSARVSVNRILRAEVFVGRRRHTLQGALVGLGAGAVAGYLQATGGGEGSVTCVTIGGGVFCQPTEGAGDARLRSAARVGLVGAAAGAVLGYVIRTERWTLVDLPRLRLQVGLP